MGRTGLWDPGEQAGQEQRAVAIAKHSLDLRCFLRRSTADIPPPPLRPCGSSSRGSGCRSSSRGGRRRSSSSHAAGLGACGRERVQLSIHASSLALGLLCLLLGDLTKRLLLLALQRLLLDDVSVRADSDVRRLLALQKERERGMRQEKDKR